MGFIASYNVSTAQAPVRGINQYTIQELVAHFSSQYHVSETQMLGTIAGESSFNPHAVGDNGCSIGVAQINLCAHKEITKEEAEDPIFSVSYMAEQFSLGHEYIWTAWRNRYE